ncbi:MAG: PSD1 and planctomycete cytochrome C domain-containing protein [Verrucomicrobiota bacterium]
MISAVAIAAVTSALIFSFSQADEKTAASPNSPHGKAEFNRDIRPIFLKHCAACHGGVKEAGGVTVVYRSNLLKPAKSGAIPLVPGDPAKSELFRRVTNTDPDEVMPPAAHGSPLSGDEIAKLESWIKDGAVWQEHWSFVLPQPTAPSVVSNPKWPKKPLDHFVLARLDREKLKPSEEADAGEWLRRVSFDLIGLPPTPEEVAALKQAADPEAARAAAVDKLLASPFFGERWASVWLDLARYADTTGFEKDGTRTIWPYRDWVIRAFNSDMSYSRFAGEQIAGDLLPSPTSDQRLATAFQRNTQTNTEGGTDDEEFRVAAVIDRTNTFWTTFQATTFGCVQCHSHPYDPIKHDEFYKFTAFYNSSEDADLDDDFPKTRIANDPARRDETSALEKEIREARNLLNNACGTLLTNGKWKTAVPDFLAPTHGTLIPSADGTVRGEGTMPVGNEHVFTVPADGFTALRLTILPESDNPKDWPERGSLVTRFSVIAVNPDGTRAPVPFSGFFADKLSGPYDPWVSGNFGDYPKLHSPVRFAFVPASPFVAKPGQKLEVHMTQGGSTTGAQSTPVRRFKVELSSDPAWTSVLSSEAYAGNVTRLHAARGKLAAIPGLDVPVMVKRYPDATRETRVFAKGNRLTKDKVVHPGVPELLAGRHTNVSDRLEMAKWLVDGENPLTSRVMVNRLWGELFGIGIVETQEDFGTSGTLPSDQALLDHLALRFQNDHKWSVKSMLREIVLSATYRQTNKADDRLVEMDPDNRLLARGPRVRLTAEMVRDQMLAVSGLLSNKMFGSPVFPPQPAGVWSTVYNGAKWNESRGEDRYRRAIYTFVRRTAGYPTLLTFDAPARDICSARRITSNTPLQPLVTLNDPAHMEGAQAFAKRLSREAPALRERIARGFALATQRTASSAVLDQLEGLYRDALTTYQAAPQESAKLASTPEEAALVITANTILNLDSALNR